MHCYILLHKTNVTLYPCTFVRRKCYSTLWPLSVQPTVSRSVPFAVCYWSDVVDSQTT